MRTVSPHLSHIEESPVNKTHLLSGTTVDLLLELGKLASNVSSVAIKHRAIASSNLSRVVHDDHLNLEIEKSLSLSRIQQE